MKKIFIVLLTAVYLLSAIGVSASSFYCCGVLKSTTFSIGDHGSDSKAAAQSDHCCKTTKQSFKVKDNHYSAGTFSLATQFFPLTLPFSLLKLNDEPFTRVYTAFNSHAPPFWQHAIYLLNCTYRI